MLSSVLLPQPLGPIRATTSPSATEKLTSRIAIKPCVPEASAKRMVTLRYSRRTTGGIEQTFPKEGRRYRRPLSSLPSPDLIRGLTRQSILFTKTLFEIDGPPG